MIKIYLNLKKSPYKNTTIIIGKFYRRDGTTMYWQSGFSTYGTYIDEYRCWKQSVSFKHRGYYSFRTPLIICLYLIVKSWLTTNDKSKN